MIECMLEVACYQMPYSLCHLFATILINCNLANAKELWEHFEDPMSDDFKYLQNINVK